MLIYKICLHIFDTYRIYVLFMNLEFLLCIQLDLCPWKMGNFTSELNWKNIDMPLHILK